MTWILFGNLPMISCFHFTCLGYSHLKNHKICQDDSASYIDAERKIVTACDGHGGKIYVRSNRGSKFASKAVLRVFKSIHADTLQDPQYQERIRLRILCCWNDFVEQDFARSPFLEEELSELNEEEKALLRQEPQIAYGSTLQGAMMLGDSLVIVSLGDGGCLLWNGRNALPALEEEKENVANFTASLCQPDAYSHLRLRVFPLNQIDGVLVYTDGLINPYQTFLNFYSSCFLPVKGMLERGNRQEIIDYLVRVALVNGTGDDVSLGAILKEEAHPSH